MIYIIYDSVFLCSKILNSGLKGKQHFKTLVVPHAFLLLWGSGLSAKCDVFAYSDSKKKKKVQKEPTTQYLIKDREMEDFFEWNFEQIEMLTMLPTGNNTQYNKFSFVVSYLSSCVLLSLLHTYNIKQTTVCGNVVGLSAKPAVFTVLFPSWQNGLHGFI